MTDASDLLVVLAGPFVGSFLALAAVRLPDGEDIVRERSRCRSCDTPLAPADLVPILSWCLRRGRCAYCGARIGLVHPLVEAGALVLPLWAATMMSGWLLWATTALGWTLLFLAAIDWRALTLPDAATLPLAAAGFGVVALLDPSRLPHHVLGAALGFAVFAAIGWAYLRLRDRPGLGLGDAKLLAAGGAWTGWAGLPGIVLWGAAAALVWVAVRAVRAGRLEPDRPIPFGPFLCLGVWLVWLYGPVGFG